MSENTVGIKLEVEGEAQVTESMEKAAAALDTFTEAAETAADSTSALDEALEKARIDEEIQKDWDDFAVSTAQLAEGLAKQAAGVEKFVSSFMSAVGDVAETGDTIDKQSQKLGISAKAYQEWSYVLGQSGVNMSSMKTAFDQVRKVQTGYAKDAASDLAAIGLSLETVTRMSKEDAFAAILAGLQGLAEGAERESVAKGLLGSSYKELGPLMNMTAEETQGLIDHLYEIGGVMSDEDVQAAAAYQDSIDDLSHKWESFKRDIFSEFIPALTDLRNNVLDNESLDNLAEKLSSLAGSAVGLLEFLVDHSDQAVTAVEAIGAAWGTWKAAGVVKELVTNVTQLYGWLGKLGGVLGISTGAAAGGLAVGALGVATVVDEISTLQKIGYLGKGHELQEYADNVAYYEEAIAAWHERNDEYLQSGYTEGLEMLQNELKHYTEGLAHAQEEYEAMQAAAANAADAPQELSTATAESAETVERATGTLLETITDTAGDIRDDFVQGVDGMAEAAADEVIATNDAMATNMAILSANAAVWGEDMMISLANGIRTGGNSWVLPAVDELAAAIDAYLGHSEPDKGPLAHDSQWMPDMMRSMAAGINDNSYLVTDAMAALAGDIAPYFEAGMDGGGSSYNYGGVSVTFQVQEGQDGRALFEEFSYWLQNQINEEGAVFAQ